MVTEGNKQKRAGPFLTLPYDVVLDLHGGLISDHSCGSFNTAHDVFT
jgi:hypothetical protein